MFKKVFIIFLAILLLVSVNCVIYVYLQRQVNEKYQKTLNMLNEANNKNKQLQENIMQLEKSQSSIKENSNNKSVVITGTKDSITLNNVDIFIKELNKDIITNYTKVLQQDNANIKPIYYCKDGDVYVKNVADSSYSVYGSTNAIDLNKPYKDLINKFIALYNNGKINISDEQLKKAGFNPQLVKQYGFSPFLNISQDTEVMCKEYIINRESYELKIEKYRNGSISEEEMQKSLKTFVDFKESMNKFLSQNIMGDL